MSNFVNLRQNKGYLENIYLSLRVRTVTYHDIKREQSKYIYNCINQHQLSLFHFFIIFVTHWGEKKFKIWEAKRDCLWVGKRDITHTTNNEQQQTVVVKYTVVSMKKRLYRKHTHGRGEEDNGQEIRYYRTRIMDKHVEAVLRRILKPNKILDWGATAVYIFCQS